MSRSGCVDGPGIGSSGNDGAGGSRWERDGKGSRFEGGDMIGARGKEAGVKAAVVFAEIDGGVGGGRTSVLRRGFLDDDFRCRFIRVVDEEGFGD